MATPAPRICSLLPSATEIVGTLGLARHIVGITHECDVAPDEAGLQAVLDRGVPRVTTSDIDPATEDQADIDRKVKESLRKGLSLYQIDDAKFQAGNPTVILTQALCTVCAPSIGHVEGACSKMADVQGEDSGPRVLSLEPRTLDEVAETFRTVAVELGFPERFDPVYAHWKQGMEAVAAATALRKAEKPVTMLLEWCDPPFAGGHWVPDSIARAGCIDAFHVGKAVKSSQVTWDDIVKADPDCILIACCGFDVERNAKDGHRRWTNTAEWAGLRAVRENRVFAVDGNRHFARPSPSLLTGVAVVARCSYDGDEAVVEALEKTGLLPQQGPGRREVYRRLSAPEGWVPPAAAAAPPAAGAHAGLPSDDVPDIESCWDRLHEEACKAGERYYADPGTGFKVMTADYHRARGRCCGSGCRHCPYAHENVKPEDKAKRIQNPAWLTSPAPPVAEEGSAPEVDVLFWSTGKDSFLTSRALRKEGLRPLVLLTTFDAATRVVAHQDTKIDDALRQATALGLSLLAIPLRRGGPRYTDNVSRAFAVIRKSFKIRRVAFGDLHLEHVRHWRESVLPAALQEGETLVYPLWKVPYEQLLADLRESKVPCVVSALGHEQAQMAERPVNVGDVFDERLSHAAAAAGWDGFGENGEFHTLARVWEEASTA
eukprot:TRINITY_DN8627_c0_g1_i1.p1 TRINITY_DN8627_c0_g1~~TRINITY_DN8627_c0_g1_i1.p1  ORF type:complete len:659 (+),score=127.36 TRINITY_DN8627_c0_g1_i1:814-2790(+)